MPFLELVHVALYVLEVDLMVGSIETASSMALNDSKPFVCACYLTYSPALCFTDSCSKSIMLG